MDQTAGVQISVGQVAAEKTLINPARLCMVLIASHTMPDILTPILKVLLLFSALPLIVFSVIGSRIGFTPFRWKQIGFANLGILSGLFTVLPFSLLVIKLGMEFGWHGAILGGVIGCLAGCCVSYGVSLNGRTEQQRPKESVPRTTVAQNDEIPSSSRDVSNPYVPPR